ncbi:hypothetical protein ACFWZ2_40840 [Streptomyces sp. NPDC059002]|uniref:hypothetical protein n=1 Tax=Streptomyces sp. NPDC059002 TaxID=3346690 RepID=UPI00369289BB
MGRRPLLLGALAPLRPGALGLFVFAEAAALAWVAADRARPPAPQPGDHAWFHSSGPVTQPDPGVGVLLALVTVAVFLLLPLHTAAARLLRGRRGRVALPGFLAATVVAGAAVSVPVVALATAFSPVGAALWPAVGADAVTALRLYLPAGLLIAACAGAPWVTAGAEESSPGRKTVPC